MVRILRVILIAAFALVLVNVPATAGMLYDNGPDPGNILGRPISLGNSVTDNFVLVSDAQLGWLVFSTWLSPGDTPISVDWTITSLPFGGAMEASGTGLLTVMAASSQANSSGYFVYTVSMPLSVSLTAGTYWLQLGNEVVTNGDAGFWGQNNGPSSAREHGVGAIPSEAFTLFDNGGITPEPGTIALFGSGLLLLAGGLRRSRR